MQLYQGHLKVYSLLVTLHTLESWNDDWGLPSRPQGLHSLSSLMGVVVMVCPGRCVRGDLPVSLRQLDILRFSAELQEGMKKLEGTNPTLAQPKA